MTYEIPPTVRVQREDHLWVDFSTICIHNILISIFLPPLANIKQLTKHLYITYSNNVVTNGNN